MLCVLYVHNDCDLVRVKAIVVDQSVLGFIDDDNHMIGRADYSSFVRDPAPWMGCEPRSGTWVSLNRESEGGRVVFVEIRYQRDANLLADVQGCPHEGKVVDMKGIELEVSDISLDAGCPIGVCEGEVKAKGIQASASRL
jgi:hypothetical protein